MKIKTKKMDYEKVMEIPSFLHQKPQKPSKFLHTLVNILSRGELKKVHFSCQEIGMEKLGKKEPCLILMNHSSFIDLKIASKLLYPRPYSIVCTYDGFVGKEGLLRRLGCIPTRKFTNDMILVRDIAYALHELKSSVLMYPEASYSFDGTQTPLPESLGKCIKLLEVPVVLIQTEGAFARDPLYNNLQVRDVEVSATMTYFLSPEEIKELTAKEINERLSTKFEYDHFKWQQEKHVSVKESFRADYLNRVLYKCPSCMTEGNMEGKGVHLTCHRCKKTYELTEYGEMKAVQGETEISHIPDWYRWERESVRQELLEGKYKLELPVDIYMMVDTSCVYQVGEGILQHTSEGFVLDGCEGKLHYEQKPKASYSLYADYYWYEIGDMICIGDERAQYYCFPKGSEDVVAKARLATEELYKFVKKSCVVKVG